MMSLIGRFLTLFIRVIKPNNYLVKLLGVTLGQGCKFIKGVDFGSEPYLISIDDNFYCSANVRFVTHDGSVNVLRNLNEKYADADILAPINIGKNVFVGMDVIILPGVNIGDNVIVGAGSIVNKNLASNSVYAGVPCRLICSLDEFERKKAKSFIYSKGLTNKKDYLIKHFDKG